MHAAGERAPSAGSNAPPVKSYSAAPWLRNCGNCATGSVFAGGLERTRESSGFVGPCR